MWKRILKGLSFVTSNKEMSNKKELISNAKNFDLLTQ